MGDVKRVSLYQQPGFAKVEAGATVGATIGVNLFDTDGSVVDWTTIATRVGGTGGDTGGGSVPTEVYWRTIRETPDNVVALEEAVGTGLFAVIGPAVGAFRELEATPNRTTVANGDGASGNPVIDLAVVPDSGAGTLLGITRDSWGRVTGTRAVSTDDLDEGVGNLYFTSERAQDAVGAILADTVTIEFTYDDAGNLITADLSGLVLASLAAADSALQPGDNVSELTNDANYVEDAPSDGKLYGRKDGAWEEVSATPTGTWDLDDLATPPEVWFDADVDAGLVTTAAGSNIATAVASRFNSGTYAGTPGTSIVWQKANPKFNRRGSLFFPGTSPNRLTVTGAAAIGQNVAGITLFALVAFRNDNAALSNGGAGIVYVGTPTADASRASILKSSTTNNTPRLTGRMADGGSADGDDVGGNQGTTPVLLIGEFDYAAGAKRMRMNGTQQLNDTAFFTPGVSANTASDLVAFGSASTGFWGEFEMQCGGIASRIYATADLEKIEGKIMHDNGLAHLLPVGHPYRDSPP